MTDGAVEHGGDISTASSLIERAAARQVDAWERLVSLYGPLVYRWCRRWGLQPTDAENVGQEVFAKLAAALSAFRHDRAGDTFRGWLYQITYHSVADHFRQRGAAAVGIGGNDARKQLEQFPATSPTYPCETSLVREDDALVYRQIVQFIRNEFSDRDWAAFYRVVVDGLSAGEVAEELGVTTNVVYLARSRVLRRVREEFAGLIADAR